jgi:hypothetical protein
MPADTEQQEKRWLQMPSQQPAAVPGSFQPYSGEPKTLQEFLAQWDTLHNTALPDLVTNRDVDMKGNVLAMGPAAQEYSEIESLLLVVAIKKMLETPQGTQAFAKLAIEYLKQMGEVLKSLHMASSSNWLNCVINQFTAVKIYCRMGLLTPYDSFVNLVWLDHVLAEALKFSYVSEGLGSVNTLVQTVGKVAGESIAAEGAIAKVLAEKP